MVRQLLSFAVLLAAAAALSLTMAAAADSKDDKGSDKWTPLFNGKDLTGWMVPPDTNPTDFKKVVKKEASGKVVGYYGELKKDDKEVPLWRVDEGILIGSGPHSHLFSERGDFENFRYRVEAMINDHGNSGQFFRTAVGPHFPKGYEAQINSTHGDTIRTGSLYPSFGPPKEDRDKILIKKQLVKPNEWFTQEVIARGNHIIIKVNGETTVDYVDEKNTHKTGHFALQGHDPGTVVKFRKIEVIELSADKKER